MLRRERLEEMLKDNPDDEFLRYGVALEYAKEGKVEEAIRQLKALFADRSEYVAAYQQAGQLLAQRDRAAEAREALQAGIAAAQRTGDLHAAEEMQALLEQLGG